MVSPSLESKKLSETVLGYAYFILSSQTSTRSPILGHEALNLDAQRVFLNTFENIVSRRVNIPEDIQRFQKTLQYAGSKVDYAISEFIHILPSDMNLGVGKVNNHNNKILISSPSFKIGTNLKINLNEEEDKPGVKRKGKEKMKSEPDIKSNKEHKQDVKITRTEPNIEFKEEDKLDINPPMVKPFQLTYLAKGGLPNPPLLKS